jgi:hypothetical protein
MHPRTGLRISVISGATDFDVAGQLADAIIALWQAIRSR